MLVLLAPGTTAESVAALDLPQAIETRRITDPMPRPRDYDAVVLVVTDLVALRRAVTGIANYGTARTVAVSIERPVTRLPLVTHRPEWPSLEQAVACRSGDQFVLLRFAANVAVRPVLLQMARAAAPACSLATGWPALGVSRDDPDRWPPASPGTAVMLPAGLFASTTDLPPDLILARTATPAPAGFTETPHPVLGRPPRVHVEEPEPTWEQFAEMSPTQAELALESSALAAAGRLDDQMINPIGFDRDSVGPPARLVPVGTDVLAVAHEHGSQQVRIDAHRGVTDADLPELRRQPGLRLGWHGGAGPHDYCRVVVGLAMAGVPLVTDQVPGWARKVLAPDLLDAFTNDVELADRLAREEQSIRLRRAALRTYAGASWRRTLARSYRLQETPAPRISVVLTTRRPDMVPFALRQAARQRGTDFELLLATHGFQAASENLDAFRAASDAPLTSFAAEQSLSFGEVLNEAASRASGDLLLKMDDDDWYGPDFMLDLVLAHGYSGAQVVGCFSEFTFLQPLWLTTRRPAPSEIYTRLVSGGTMLVERGVLRALGGFRHTIKHVDAGLLSAVAAAGGSIYRSHGLGYVLRRGAQGHTWDPGMGYFVTRDRGQEQWRGFRPSSLLEPVQEDLPVRPGALVPR